MRTYLDCLPCFLKQGLEAARLAGADVGTQKKVADSIAACLPTIPLASSPPETAGVVHGIVRKLTGSEDPYGGIRGKSNRLALEAYDLLKRKVARSKDGLLTAVELAIAGNIIDYGAKSDLNVEAELAGILRGESGRVRRAKRAVFDYPGFKRELGKAGTILYLADNAGETVFDRVLIEEIKRRGRGGDKRVLYAVKEKPVINDALTEDAVACGVNGSAEVVSSGAETPGTVLKRCGRGFRKVFREADMVISKGQGNYEALSGSKRPVFFLLMAKCPVIARHISSSCVECSVGDVILQHRQ